MHETSNDIDYILVYKNTDERRRLKRLMFQKSLLEIGLRLRTEVANDMVFVKVNVPEKVLFKYAELLRLRMPIKVNLSPDSRRSSASESQRRRFLDFLSITRIRKKYAYKLTAEFARNRMYLYDQDDPDFFNSSARFIVAAYIIDRAPYGNIYSSGIQPLISDGVFLQAYPLHDGSLKDVDSMRYRLLQEWASMARWLSTQPLDDIRNYFGANVALYFTWLGFYTKMLIPASIVSLIAIALSIFLYTDDSFSQDMCSQNVTMCPLCDSYCDYWNLKAACWYSRLSHLANNYCTIAFCMFMSLWNTLYLVLWKRHSARVTYTWGLTYSHTTAEPTRPEFLSRLRKTKRRKLNVLTLSPEPYMPFWTRRFPIFIFTGITCVLWISAEMFIYLVINFFQMTLKVIIVHEEHFMQHTFTVVSTFFDLVTISSLYFLFKRCTIWLTDLEMHRTHSEYENSVSLKLYSFQFMTHYTPVFYLAFLKGNFIGIPGSYNRIFGYRGNECIGGGCLWEVMLYIGITMTFKQVIYVMMERYFSVVDIFKCNIRELLIYAFGKPKPPRSQMVEDFQLLDLNVRHRRGLHCDYLEMAVQFGLVTMFVNAFPIAPVFACFFNLLRIRVEALRHLKYYKRPVPTQATNIGIWLDVINFICRISVVSNAFMIAFSSRFIPRLVFYFEGFMDGLGDGFLMLALSKFDVRDFEPGKEPEAPSDVEFCYYFGLRYPPEHPDRYKRTFFYWQIIAARLTFIIIYYVLANLMISFVEWMVPAIPQEISDKIQIENYHFNKAVLKKERAQTTSPDNVT